MARSLGVLAVQAALLAGLAAGSVAIVGELEIITIPQRLSFYLQREWRPLVSMGLIQVIAGVWLTVGLGHWRWWAPWAAWAALLTVLQTWALRGASLDFSALRTGRWEWRELLLLAMMAVAVAGVPLGLAIRQAHVRHLRSRWQRRRRRLRAERTPA
jgi:hypothetical protein